MKILQVLTYLSPDGAYGGPARVALAQSDALARLGHEVTLVNAAPVAAVTQGRSEDGVRLMSYPSRRLPGLGFAGLTAPAMVRALRGLVRHIDVAHVHLSRDLVSLPAAAAAHRAGVPFFAQTHGMIDPSEKLLSKPLDLLGTRPLLRSAAAVLVLTDEEEGQIHAVAPQARIQRVRNGLRLGDLPAYADRSGPVLFLSRLQERKRPVAFVEAAAVIAAANPDVTFVLAGPHEGEGPAVEAAIARSGYSDRIRWIGPVDMADTDELLRSAKAFVLPSVNEVFPMALVEAFRAGTPAVMTESLGIAQDVLRYGAGLVTDGSVPEVADAISRVLKDITVAEDLRSGAWNYLRSELDIDKVARGLVESYERAI